MWNEWEEWGQKGCASDFKLKKEKERGVWKRGTEQQAKIIATHTFFSEWEEMDGKETCWGIRPVE